MKRILQLVTVLSLAAVAHATPIIIDSFDEPIDPFQVACAPSGLCGASSSQYDGMGPIGSRRKLLVTRTSSTGRVSAAINDPEIGEVLDFQQTTSATGDVKITYDNFGTVDLSLHTVIELLVNAAGTGTLTVELTSGTDVFAITQSLATGLLNYSLAAYAAAGIDLAAVTQIVVTLYGDTATDAQIDHIQANVPEPGTFIITGIGALALGLLRRRRTA